MIREPLSLADDYSGKPSGFLFELLRTNTFIQELRRLMIESNAPLSVLEIADAIFPQLGSKEERLQALYHLIELGTLARPNPDSLPLIPAKYHLFARPPQGIWVCLNPDCPGKEDHPDTEWSTLYATRHEKCDICGSAVFPLHVCRTCGQAFVRMEKRGDQYLSEADLTSLADHSTQYFTWKPIEENESLSDLDEDEWLEQIKSGLKYDQEEETICLTCQKPIRKCSCEESQCHSVTLHRILNLEGDEKKGVRKTRH